MGLIVAAVIVSSLFAMRSISSAAAAAAAAAAQLTKCCPLHQEVFVNSGGALEAASSEVLRENVFCSRTGLYALVTASWSSLEVGLPANCTRISFVDVYSKEVRIHCVDRVKQLRNIYGIRCADEAHNRTVTRNVNTIGPIISLRKCCPATRLYDADKQYCWNPLSSSEPITVSNLLKLTPWKDIFVNVSYGAPRCRRNDVLLDTMMDYREFRFLPTEALSVRSAELNAILSYDEYCVDLVEDRFEYLVVRYCQDYIPACKHSVQKRVCVRKCCPVDFEVHNRDCVPTIRSLSLSSYNLTQRRTNEMVVSAVRPAYLQGDVCVRGKYLLEDTDDDRHILTTDGTVFMAATNSVIDVDSYCVDNRKMYEGAKTYLCFPSGAKSSIGVMQKVKPVLTTICAGISAFFLLLTFLIYTVLPSLRNVQGKLIMCYLFASTLSYTMVVVQRILPVGWVSMDLCKVLGYIMLGAVLSSFCWLNVISYDIWTTFKVVKSAFLKKSNTNKKLLLYCLYGWGFPMAWTGFAILCQHIPMLNESKIWKPDISKNSCWFSDHGSSKLVYFIAPVAVMITFNTIMFIVIVKYCAHIRAELSNANNNTYSLRKYTANKNEFVINIKLFVIMGLNWSLEIVSLTVQPRNRIFFIISDLINASVGVIVFCILILKRKVLHDLKMEICGNTWKERRRGVRERGTRSTVSSASVNMQSFTNSRRSAN